MLIIFIALKQKATKVAEWMKQHKSAIFSLQLNFEIPLMKNESKYIGHCGIFISPSSPLSFNLFTFYHEEGRFVIPMSELSSEWFE